MVHDPISVLDALMIALSGIVIVFLMLALLWGVIAVISRVMGALEKHTAHPASVGAAAPAAAAPAAAPKAAAGAGSIQVKAGAAGKVFQVPTSVGQKVEAGDTVIIIEAMKMEIPVVAPEAGTIASIDVAVGDAVESGAVLATLN